jgi:hypothetical protein
MSVRSDHAALAVVSEEECNRLGDEFFLVVAERVAGVFGGAQPLC